MTTAVPTRNDVIAALRGPNNFAFGNMGIPAGNVADIWENTLPVLSIVTPVVVAIMKKWPDQDPIALIKELRATVAKIFTTGASQEERCKLADLAEILTREEFEEFCCLANMAAP